MNDNALRTPASQPGAPLRAHLGVAAANGAAHQPPQPAPHPRVRAGEPLSDAEHIRRLREGQLLDKARHATEVKLAYQRGHREGEKRGLQATKRSWFWSGVGFGVCVGSLLVLTMLNLGLAQ
jgi:hypothetical protein